MNLGNGVSAYQYPSENQNPGSMLSPPPPVSAYQYPSENQNLAQLMVRYPFVSAYQYPSENQNSRRIFHLDHSVSAYQYPSENQNDPVLAQAINGYQLINIHQRTKTKSSLLRRAFRISLSISIREPKRNCV